MPPHLRSDALRDEGGYDFKKSIVDAIIKIIETISQAKEEGMGRIHRSALFNRSRSKQASERKANGRAAPHQYQGMGSRGMPLVQGINSVLLRR